MRKPQKLSPGDRVAILSLSAGIAGEPFLRFRYNLATERLRTEFGLEAVPMPNALRGAEYLDRHPEARAADLMAAFADPAIRGIVCAIGGEDTVRLLPHIDFEVIRRNPKVFLGYSDTTVNHFMLRKAGLVSYYGPCLLCEFAENVAMHDYTKRQLRATLFEPAPTLDIPPSPDWTAEYLDWAVPENNLRARAMTPDGRGYLLLQGSGVARGPLLGGCVDVLPMLVGTPLWPAPAEWEGHILFLETSEELMPPAFFRFVLRGLVAQGVVGRLAGILFAKPMGERHQEEYHRILTRVVGEEAGRPDLPILCNLNFGHNAPMCVLPCGIAAEIDCARRSLRLLEPAVAG